MNRILVGAALLASTVVPAAAHAQSGVEIDWPLGIGLRLPAYDRINGASVPFGPTITVGDDRLTVEPVITYRSHLGKIDPSLRLRTRINDLFSVTLSGSRETFTNDAWIRSTAFNTLAALAVGRDTRNYYRADRGEGWVTVAPWRDEGRSLSFDLGARFENAWSTGWRPGEKNGPWAIIDREDDLNGIQRPNPTIDRGHTESYFLRARSSYITEWIQIEGQDELEAVRNTPTGGAFTQLTVHKDVMVPTVFDQRLEVSGHLITNIFGDRASAQRYGYLGGAGSLWTIDLLTLGGDRLYFTQVMYVIPIPGVDLPFIGRPFVAPRFATGAAGVEKFGVPVQNAGVRLGLGLLEVDFVVNPRTHVKRWGIGVSFPR